MSSEMCEAEGGPRNLKKEMIICTESLKKFLITLGLTFFLTVPQFKHLVSIIIAAMQGGFDGKIKNVPELSMRKIHRTSVGKFLSKSPWPEKLVIRDYQDYVIARIRWQALVTGCPVYVILDDTCIEKTKPSSKAKRPIAGCCLHWSHLKKGIVYGHQLVGVPLVCGHLKLPYYLELYDKKVQSKIEMVTKVILGLPDFPTPVYVLGDSWYSARSVISAARFRGFHYIGALKTNRILYIKGGSKLGLPVGDYVKTLTKARVHLVTVGKQRYWVHRVNGHVKRLPQDGVILISWPESQLFQEKAMNVFFSTCKLPDEVILTTYTERWTIEIFFRDNKMQLEIDRYQIRSQGAITRFLYIIMIAYAYCSSLAEAQFLDGTLSAARKQARTEMKCQLVAWVYQQACASVSLPQVNEQLGLLA